MTFCSGGVVDASLSGGLAVSSRRAGTAVPEAKAGPGAAGGGDDRPLGNNESCLTPQRNGARGLPKAPYSTSDTRSDRNARRAARERDQAMLGRLLLHGTNISGCGKRAIRDRDGNVRPIEIRRDDEAGAYFSGVMFCGSVWLCPRCSPVVLHRRGQEIDRIARTVFDHGGTAFLLTLTVRHKVTDSAQELIDFVIPGLSRLLKGAKWTKLAKSLGYIGLTRVAEITWSTRSGFHPHIHAGLFFDRPLTWEEQMELEMKLRKWWVKLVQHPTDGLDRTVVPNVAVDLREWTATIEAPPGVDPETVEKYNEGCGPAYYLTKIGHGWGIGSELAGGHVKHAKGWSLNPAQLVAAWVTSVLQGDPDEQLARVIKELHTATHGRRMTQTSAPLRKWVAERTDEVEETEAADEEIVHEDVGGEVIAEIDPEVYAWIDRFVARTDLLEGAETGGVDGVVQALKDRGLPVRTRHRPSLPDGRRPSPVIQFDQAWHHAQRPAPIRRPAETNQEIHQ